MRFICATLIGGLVSASTAVGQTRSDSAYPPPVARYKFTVTKNIMVPMRDGVRLATDVYQPTGVDRLPVILIRLPYNKDTYRGAIGPAEFFAGQGYVVVVQDTRGKWHSEGTYAVQMADAQDGYDAIDWASKQRWSTGKVGTYGCSYLGEVQYLLLKMHHPAHLAAIPQAASGAVGPAGGYYTNFGTYSTGGAMTLSSIVGWFSTAGTKVKGAHAPESIDFGTLLHSLPTSQIGRRGSFPPTDFDDFMLHPPADPYWYRMHYLSDTDRINTPVLQVNSWGDVTPEQTLYAFNLMRRNAMSARARDNQFVIMSPTTHCGSERGASAHTMVGALDVGDARLDYWQIYLKWFDHWLKADSNGVNHRPKVQYFEIGEGTWHSAPSWPVPGMRSVSYYLTSARSARTGAGDGQLSPAAPSRSSVDTITYDPGNPFPSRGGGICCTGNPKDLPGIFDQHDLESRPDVLVYSTPVLASGVSIAGPVRVKLVVSSDATDSDIAAKLLDVDESGHAWNVANGILRLRYRRGLARPQLMKRDTKYRVEVNLNTVAWYFKPGHRIRLYVTSSDFPMYDRNLNTGGDNVTETKWVVAHNVVRAGGGSGSALVLPVAAAPQ